MMYQQVYARLPDSLYQAFQDYLDETGQKKTQAIVYAIAKYIRSNQMKTTTELVERQVCFEE